MLGAMCHNTVQKVVARAIIDEVLTNECDFMAQIGSVVETVKCICNLVCDAFESLEKVSTATPTNMGTPKQRALHNAHSLYINCTGKHWN